MAEVPYVRRAGKPLPQRKRPYYLPLNNLHSPFKNMWPRDMFQQQCALLTAEGFTRQVAGNAVREVHDSGHHASSILLPGIVRYDVVDGEAHERSVALKVEDSTALIEAAITGEAPFDIPRVQAVTRLILSIDDPLGRMARAASYRQLGQSEG